LRVKLPNRLTALILKVLTGRQTSISERNDVRGVDDQIQNEDIYKDIYLFKDRPYNETSDLVLVTVGG